MSTASSKPGATRVWGIDLGTTNSVIAQLVDGKAVPIAIDGSAIVPSIVLFHEDGSVVVGRPARNLELVHPERALRSAKRKIGTDHRYVVPLAAGARSLSPEEVSAEVLRALKQGAEASTGVAVDDVVITVPAYFDDAQRRATLKAGELAGLNVLRLLNEPTSAALVYEQAGLGAAGGSQTLLVYDLGGGTFDVSVLDVFEGIREVKATAGNTHLGGDDFDDLLLRMFVDRLRIESAVDVTADARAMARLRRLAEDTKIKLSTDTEARVREEFIATSRPSEAGGAGTAVHLDLELDRTTLEDLLLPLISSTIELSRRAVRDAGLEPESIDAICLVGGSTRIPLVRRLLADAFEAEVHEEIDPDLAVGLGAAVQAGLLKGVAVERILVDVAAHTLGIRAVGELDDFEQAEDPDTFAAVLRRNTALPAERAEMFATVVNNQPRIEVTVFQGEHPRCSQNTRVGSFTFPLVPAPAHNPVRCSFAYDLNGIIRVHVKQMGTDNEKTVAMTVADASAPSVTVDDDDVQQAIAAPGAVERRARKLLERPEFAQRAELLHLLDVYLGARAAERQDAEDALLDFFFEVEAEG
ncbi:MAG: Hsp70 family protein [Deltaproteobacteria bacterium]|nr:Hsp70 family protein [Deltaproteobacteria bacterium]